MITPGVNEITLRRALSWFPSLSNSITSQHAIEQRARRWFLRIEIRATASLMVDLNLVVLKPFPRKARSFFLMSILLNCSEKIKNQKNRCLWTQNGWIGSKNLATKVETKFACLHLPLMTLAGVRLTCVYAWILVSFNTLRKLKVIFSNWVDPKF